MYCDSEWYYQRGQALVLFNLLQGFSALCSEKQSVGAAEKKKWNERKGKNKKFLDTDLEKRGEEILNRVDWKETVQKGVDKLGILKLWFRGIFKTNQSTLVLDEIITVYIFRFT